MPNAVLQSIGIGVMTTGQPSQWNQWHLGLRALQLDVNPAHRDSNIAASAAVLQALPLLSLLHSSLRPSIICQRASQCEGKDNYPSR